MEVEFNQQFFRDLEENLSMTVEVPRDGTEEAAMLAVKEQYIAKTGIEMDDDTLREVVRQAREQ